MLLKGGTVARKTMTKDPVPDWVRIRVLRSFGTVVAGDEADLALDQRVQGWINAGLVKVVDGGPDQAGPSGSEPDPEGGVPGETGGGRSSGDEPGEDPGAS